MKYFTKIIVAIIGALGLIAVALITEGFISRNNESDKVIEEEKDPVDDGDKGSTGIIEEADPEDPPINDDGNGDLDDIGAEIVIDEPKVTQYKAAQSEVQGGGTIEDDLNPGRAESGVFNNNLSGVDMPVHSEAVVVASPLKVKAGEDSEDVSEPESETEPETGSESEPQHITRVEIFFNEVKPLEIVDVQVIPVHKNGNLELYLMNNGTGTAVNIAGVLELREGGRGDEAVPVEMNRTISFEYDILRGGEIRKCVVVNLDVLFEGIDLEAYEQGLDLYVRDINGNDTEYIGNYTYAEDSYNFFIAIKSKDRSRPEGAIDITVDEGNYVKEYNTDYQFTDGECSPELIFVSDKSCIAQVQVVFLIDGVYQVQAQPVEMAIDVPLYKNADGTFAEVQKVLKDYDIESYQYGENAEIQQRIGYQ